MEIQLPISAGRLGALFGAEIIGDPQAEVVTLSALNRAGVGALSFLTGVQHSAGLESAKGSVVFTRADLVRKELPVTYLVVPDPRASFAKVAESFKPVFPWTGISPLAVIDPTADVDPSAHIGPYVCIGEGSRIGARTVIYPFSFIGKAVAVGDDCEIHPNTTLHDRSVIGNRVRIFAGTVVGSDGFGYFRSGNTGPHQEMPQIGNVRVEDDVRLGALNTLDRATINETVIRRGCKFDDQVHIGHNCDIGEDTIICGQSAMGGSVTVERDVMMGGHVGVAQGVHVKSGTRFGTKSGALSDMPGNETYSFVPAIPQAQFFRIFRALHKLPKLVDRVRELERQLAEKNNG